MGGLVYCCILDACSSANWQICCMFITNLSANGKISCISECLVDREAG